SRILSICPLHRCSRIVPAVFITAFQSLFYRAAGRNRLLILVYRTDVIILGNIISSAVGHPYFLSLIDKRNSSEENGCSRKHFFAGFILRIFRKETAYTSGLIMIFNDICLKSNPLRLSLGTENR